MHPQRETLLCRYHYDPLDRLTDCTPTAQASTQRFYLKDRLATEVQGTLQRSIMQHEDQLLAQQQHQNGTPESHLLATDQQRSVLAILDAIPPQDFAYTPYGHRVPETSLLSLLGFNGERPDPVTGHYLLGNGYRAFNPVLMRFNSPDSWSPFGKGGLNAYGYCVGDPVNRSDPSGHIGSKWNFIKKNIPRIAQMSKGPRPSTTISTPTAKTASTITTVAHAEPPTALGEFNKFLSMPDITEQIVRGLSGKDMTSLASTSNAMKQVVYQSAKPASQLLGSDMTSSNLNSAAQGNIQGILPRDALHVRQFERVMDELMVRYHDLPSPYGPNIRKPRRVE